MPRVARTEIEVDAVREKILDCTFEILVRYGYESLSLSKVGKKMRMTAANLYNYYGNKDELLIAIHKKAFGILYEKLCAAVNSADTPGNKFRNLVNAFVEFGTNNSHVYDIMFNRPIKQYTDYIGTPQEEMSRDEYQSSLRVLHLAFSVFKDYSKTRPDFERADPVTLVIQGLSALHGVISLYNSGILATIIDNPGDIVRAFAEDTMAFGYLPKSA